jgi:DNA-binding MarR family transcriptional regulator
VAKGLVERTPREGDRREVLVHLTAQGRALHAALLPRVAQINRELLSALDEGEVRQLVRFLERLQRQAEAMRADRAP